MVNNILAESQFNSSIRRGIQYLKENTMQGAFECYISNNRTMTKPAASPKEIGSSAIVYNTAVNKTKCPDLSSTVLGYINSNMDTDYAFHFFEDESLLPKDADTTAYILSSLIQNKKLNVESQRHKLYKLAQNIISNNNGELFCTYFSPEKFNRRNTVDIVANANILYFLKSIDYNPKSYNHDNKLMLLSRHLHSGEFLKGSLYYFSPQSNIYFISRILDFEDTKPKLQIAVHEAFKQIGFSQNPIDIAMRVTTSVRMDELDETALCATLDLQEPDGSWPADAIFKFGSKTGYFGSKCISTAFSIEAILSATRFLQRR